MSSPFPAAEESGREAGRAGQPGGGSTRPVRKAALLGALLGSFLCMCASRIPAEVKVRQGTEKANTRIRTIVKWGGRVDWSHSGNDLIAFDGAGKDGYFDVFVVEPDGTGRVCLTCGKKGLPQRQNGQPAWHPSGEFILFQSQDPGLKGPKAFRNERVARLYTNPGAGINNNLWIMSSEGSSFWQLTHVADRMGVLHPHVSRDGTKLAWSERVGKGEKRWGAWVMRVAELAIEGGVPRLRETRTYHPGKGPTFYETHGFSPDGKSLAFSSDLNLGRATGLDIYLLQLETGDLTRLTATPTQWDEHAQFSPDGKRIAWISSQGVEEEAGAHTPTFRTELWIMDADGKNQKRVTYFNDPNAPEYIPGGIAVADNSWNAEGTQIAAYLIHRGKPAAEGSIVVIDLKNSPLR